MMADAWILALLVREHGWHPETIALLDRFTATVATSKQHRHPPGCRCPRA
jgi:hypothetical protein